MPDQRWLGAALPVAQVSTITVAGTWATAETAVLTINNKSLTLTLGTDTSTSAVATALKEMINGDTQTGTGDHTFSETGNDVPEFDEITATVSGSVVTLTADDEGVPFTLTSDNSGSTSGTLTDATPTAATGPHHWGNAANWSTGSVPVNADDVWIDSSDVSILYELDQSAVTLTSLNITQSFTGDIGLAEVNTSGSSDYHEYRDRYLQIGATTVNLGAGPGQGSGRINLDTGSVATTVNVFNTGSPAETDLESFQWVGTNASNVFHIVQGSAAVAGYGGDAATVSALRVGYTTSPDSDVTLRVGEGVTLTTVEMSGGQVQIDCATTTVNKSGGALTLRGTAAHGTINNDAGDLAYLTSGTLATAFTLGPGALVTFAADMRAKTITPEVQMHTGSVYFDPHGVVTLSAGFQTVLCRLSDVSIDVGFDRSFTVA